MKTAVALLACAALALPAAAHAQSNNDDFTPLGSRIKRDRQFPTDFAFRRTAADNTKVNRARSKNMLGQFSRCLYKRSNETSLELLKKTDFGFVSFDQIGITPDKAIRVYGFSDCLSRVAEANNTGVNLTFSAGGLRQWILQEAYFARYPEGATWVQPGAEIGEREYVMSANNQGVQVAMDFADCVVQADPYGADYFFRAPAGSEDEKSAIGTLNPALGPCLPQGQQWQLTPSALRVWLGEALWHAANHIGPAKPAIPRGAQ